MIATDEDALICDLAETYHIYDYRSLSPRMAAIFSCGLREDSRIKLSLAGSRYPLTTLLDVLTYDAVSWLRWSQTKDAHDGGEPPERLYDKLLGLESTKESEIMTFDTPEEFETARALLIHNS